MELKKWRFVVANLIAILVCTGHPAATSTEHEVGYLFIGGAAIFRSCRFVRLTSVRGVELIAFRGEDAFPLVANWLQKNLWNRIIDGVTIKTKPEYFIYVYANPDAKEDDRRQSSLMVEDIQLGIPLTPETLGPEYRVRIAELEKIMVGKPTLAPKDGSTFR